MSTPRVMARTAGTFYVTGGAAAGVLALLAEENAGGGRSVLGVLAALALLGGGAMLRTRRLLPRGFFQVVVLAGTALITVAIAVTADPVAATALAALYVFIAVDCFLFFPWLPALAQLGVLLAASTGVLLTHRGIGPGVAVVLAAADVAVALVVGRLAQRASSASRDGLTGLLNRRGFDDALDAALTEAEGTGRPLSLALLDVDHFKQVNDRHGHGAGDELLRAIAAACRRAAGAGLVVARLGGDEFALLMPGTAAAAALGRAEEVRAAVTGSGLSCGVAQREPGDAAGDLLRRADAALYAAKGAGRGRTLLSGAGADDGLTAALAAAIAADRVEVAFQPLVALPGRRVVGVEALARWCDPVRGAVSPADFVPAAEAAGLMVELGAAVLTRALDGARRLRESRGHRVLLAVNVSGIELAAPGYADRVLERLAASGWAPGDLVVEVTESLLEADSGPALDALARLRTAGIGVAIDDFGTGYSSFSRLDTLPADTLKLDSSFLATAVTSRRRAGMLRALVDLSRALGLTLVAEGVERPEQEALLARLGCPLAQGWLYGAPQPVEELLATVPSPARR